MSVKVLLDKPYAHFTNLDVIEGRTVLRLAAATPVTSITVKLEGESRTRLTGLKYPQNELSDKKRTEVETHKLLYKVATLFPDETVEQTAQVTYYTLEPGTYEYPFRFKFPFNNDCLNNNLATNVSVGGLKLEVGRDINEHVKKTLPPSMGTFPREAEIKYYVKATVSRPQFYKENYRDFADIKFLPIEPMRKDEQDRETYARRQHQFAKGTPSAPEKKGIFQKSSAPSPLDAKGEPPRVTVDARLPSPAILRCNEPVPLRILVKKLNESSEILSLQLLQIELIHTTHIRAHDLKSSSSASLVLLSHSNLRSPLGNGSEPVGHEWTLGNDMWNRIPLPSSVVPSFDTCNVSRTYKLEVRVGISYGPPDSSRNLIVLPLQLSVQVFSGIEPPPALLEAMGVNVDNARETSGKEPEPPAPPRPPRPAVPAYSPSTQPEGYEEAPPSYEDAIAEELGPVDGPRHEYNPLATTSGWTTADRKCSVGDNNKYGRSDERLFSNVGPTNASTESFGFHSTSTTPVDGLSIRTVQDTPPGSPVAPSSPVQQLPEEPHADSRPRRLNPFMGVPKRKPVPSPSKSKYANC